MNPLPEFGPLASILGIIACAVIGYLIVSWLIDFLRDRSAFNKKHNGDFRPDGTSGDFQRDSREKGNFRSYRRPP